jgi:hypothetical protein
MDHLKIYTAILLNYCTVSLCIQPLTLHLISIFKELVIYYSIEDVKIKHYCIYSQCCRSRYSMKSYWIGNTVCSQIDFVHYYTSRMFHPSGIRIRAQIILNSQDCLGPMFQSVFLHGSVYQDKRRGAHGLALSFITLVHSV